jgi:trk system potassium uptake protein TrkA
VLSCIVRGDRTIAPTPDDTVEAHDELLFILSAEADPQDLQAVLHSAPSAT